VSGRSLPRRPSDLRRVASAARRVLFRPSYLLLAVLVAVANVLAFVAARNYRLFVDVVLLGSQSPSARLTVLFNLLPVVGGGYEPVSAVVLLTLGVLAGVAAALFVDQFRRGRANAAAGSGGLGVLVGFAGSGCAACGAPVLAAVAGTSLAGTVTVLPLGGTEFALLAIGLLALSIWWLTDDAGDACEVDDPGSQ